MKHPLMPIAYRRWKNMDYKKVLDEMALLFHLAVKIEDVKKLDERRKA